MNLDEFREKMESDATKENEHLRSEVNLDYQALTNRCWVLTHGSMCCFCELREFRCPHAMNDWQKIKLRESLHDSKNYCEKFKKLMTDFAKKPMEEINS